jgi:hypothetical protein
MVAMAVPETTELVGELYLVPPDRFVPTRDELVRKAREAGNARLAGHLRSLRRPTQSAWLVNLLTRYERAPVESLCALGRQLRQAQVRLDGAELRRLSAQRKPMIADLVYRARRRAVEAGWEPTDKALSEVEATLQAALVDLAASSTVLSGRLVRPMSHSGFGPMPHTEGAPAPADVVSHLPEEPPAARTPAEHPAPAPPTPPPPPPPPPADGGAPAAERWIFWPVEDVPQPDRAERQETPQGGRTWPRLVAGGAAPTPEGVSEPPPPVNGHESIRRAEAALAAAESAHWQREHELADAEAAVEEARNRLQWLEQQRLEARAGKATAERHLSAARAAQRAAVRAVAQARRDLQAAESSAREGAGQPS